MESMVVAFVSYVLFFARSTHGLLSEFLAEVGTLRAFLLELGILPARKSTHMTCLLRASKQ